MPNGFNKKKFNNYTRANNIINLVFKIHFTVL